jgi:sugar phosphate isomerase/epimerase
MNKKNLFISNLAWDHSDFIKISKLLKFYKFKGLDLAPIKLNENWSLAKKQTYRFKKILDKSKLKVNAIQGIFFNTNFNLFNLNIENKKKLLNHIKKILQISRIYNCNKIIIGSSNFRRKGKISKKKANLIFVNFFKEISSLFKKEKIFICFETIPKQYGEDYLYKIDTLVKLIKKINSPWLKINFDSSLFHFRKFKKSIFLKNKKYINNIQISEKGFHYLQKPSNNNIQFCNLLKKDKSIKNVSLEIISKKTSLRSLSISLENFKNILN